MRRRIKIVGILFVIAASLAATLFGTFKYLEKRALDRIEGYLERGEPARALDFFDSWQKFPIHRFALEHNFMEPEWHYYLGLSALRSGAYALAYRSFDEAASQLRDAKPRSRAYFNQGEARLWQWDAGAFSDAAELYKKALKQDPEMILAKKRLEWLKVAKLIDMPQKGGGRGLSGKEGSDSTGKGDQPGGENEKYKSSQGKQRRGF